MTSNIIDTHRRQFLIALDIVAITISFFGAFLLRFDFTIPAEYSSFYLVWLPVFIVVKMVIFSLFGLYKGMWRFTSLWDAINIVKAVSVAGFFIILLRLVFIPGFAGIPRSMFLLDYMLTLLTVSMSRISVRIYFSHFFNRTQSDQQSSKKKLILIGAGKTGEKITREIISTPSSPYTIVGFMDDNPNKKNAMLHGYKVLGGVVDLQNITLPFDELLITAPSSTGQQMRTIVEHCKASGKRYRIVPSLTELLDKDISLSTIRDVSYVDLLGREEVKLDRNSIEDLLKGKRVLITGAGGSIGSELVKQCLAFNPSEIICVDCCEENIFELTSDIAMMKSQVVIKPILGDILAKKHMEKIFNENRPQIIFHAAAYKHVPIQELHPWAAVQTNVGGSLNIIEFAEKYRVEKFVLVSTDKAVNPVNVMGATKRLAERLIQTINSDSKAEFLAVRFGNVIGSSGSAIPTFQKQVNSGGPVTVTHPEMSRYFMSVHEAAQLILQAGAIGEKGKIFLLEMGNPINIDQMARDLITLSGFEPDKDIPIVYTGLRPGEKLYEELQSKNEKAVMSEHKKILILDDDNHKMTWPALISSVKDLLKTSESLDSDQIQTKLKQLLPDYSPRSILPISKEDRLDPFTVKGQA
ncbi:MAG: polysaccharide biosynthesis protein [Candidatus Marinimicrobia bacterium]|nr:polysaccharide biosynthesis protein [Candidatus Neomarinimicrobiota bacterium]